MLGVNGTAPLDAGAANRSAVAGRNSSEFSWAQHGEVVGGVAGCGATPPSSYLCVARILPSMAVLCCAHKIITTFGRDKLPGTEKSGARVLVGADEQGVSAAAARSWRCRFRVSVGLPFDA